MQKFTLDDLNLLIRNSNISEQQVGDLLNSQFYNKPNSWKVFIKLLVLILGMGFFVSGLFFFFAFNWENIDKFTKLGIVVGLLISITSISMLSKLKKIYKDILITTSSILIGLNFAIFGQIYQTGANAYDFFLGWTVFITLWVIITNFPPLWVFFIILLNTTLIEYTHQLGSDWFKQYIFTIIATMNFFLYILLTQIPISKTKINIPNWLNSLFLVYIYCIINLGTVLQIHSSFELSHIYLYILTTVIIILSYIYALKKKSYFYLTLISSSFVIITTSILLKFFFDVLFFFIVSGYIMLISTLSLKKINSMRKIWGENGE